MAERQVGNFPQAFSHVSLVNSAYNLSRHPSIEPQVVPDEHLAAQRGPAVEPRRVAMHGLAASRRHPVRRPSSATAKSQARRGSRRGANDEGAHGQAADGGLGPARGRRRAARRRRTGPRRRRSPSGCAAPTWRSCRARTAGRRPGATAWCSATSRSGGCSKRRRAGRCHTGTWWSASSGVPDPVPCGNCAVGEWDFCRNGQYTEHGIKSQRRLLLERYRIAARIRRQDRSRRSGRSGCCWSRPAWWPRRGSRSTASEAGPTGSPRTCVITGAGPIGLLAALIGVQRGLDVHVIDQVTTGVKPDLVHALGATYHTGPDRATACPHPDIVIECTGVASLVFDAMEHSVPAGWSVSPACRRASTPSRVDAAMLNRSMVLENEAVVGSVNANRRHYQAAADALAEGRPRLDLQAGHPARPPRPVAATALGPTPRRREGGDRGRRRDDATTEIAPGVDRDRHPARWLGAGHGGLPRRTGTRPSWWRRAARARCRCCSTPSTRSA